MENKATETNPKDEQIYHKQQKFYGPDKSLKSNSERNAAKQPTSFKQGS